ncbi:MAG: hypothetical protein JEZ08_11950 [Clostridiales bacterium]|nr:hypothetical protein [Clostridiales bacterium]
MKQIGLRAIIIFCISIIYLLSFSMTKAATDDWQERDVLGFSDETTKVHSFSIDNDGNIYVVYSIDDPTGEILPFPKAKMYDGTSWTELGSGFISDKSGGQFIVRYDDSSERLYVGFITIDGVIHIYEYLDEKWQALTTAGRLLRIDPQYIYYDFQVMSDGSLVIAYVDIEEDGKITSKVYTDGQWIALGERGFTEVTANYISLLVDRNNQYVYAAVIVERSNLEVWRYSSNSGWEMTDDSGFESEYPLWVRLEMGNGDRPILIYMDTGLEWKTVGMIYNNETWEYMEPHPFSPMMIKTFSVVMDSDGWPVVFFNDSDYENRITSMRYNGETWIEMGQRGFTKESSNIVFAGMDEDNNPFVLLPDSRQDGHILIMAYGEFQAENTTAEDEESTDVTATTDLSEKSNASQSETSEDNSSSGYIVVILIAVVVLVVIVILFIVVKRRRKDQKPE